MDLQFRRIISVLIGTILIKCGYVTPQGGGGIAIGLGMGGDMMMDTPMGELPTPLLAMGAANQQLNTGGGDMMADAHTGTGGGAGGGLDSAFLMNLFGSPSAPILFPGIFTNGPIMSSSRPVVLVPGSLGISDQQNMGARAATTEASSWQIDKQPNYVLQNEAFTALGSVGHLVRVPVAPTASFSPTVVLNQLSKGGATANQPGQHMGGTVVEIQSPSAAIVGNAVTNPNTVSISGEPVAMFNPGSGMASEMAALQASLAGEKVDMAGFAPPPFSSSVSSNTPGKTEQQVNTVSGNEQRVSLSFTGMSPGKTTGFGISGSTGTSESMSNKQMGTASISFTGSSSNFNTNSVSNTIDHSNAVPHVEDLVTSGIYPFEGSSAARDAAIGRKMKIVSDLEQAIKASGNEPLHLELTQSKPFESSVASSSLKIDQSVGTSNTGSKTELNKVSLTLSDVSSSSPSSSSSTNTKTSQMGLGQIRIDSNSGTVNSFDNNIQTSPKISLRISDIPMNELDQYSHIGDGFDTFSNNVAKKTATLSLGTPLSTSKTAKLTLNPTPDPAVNLKLPIGRFETFDKANVESPSISIDTKTTANIQARLNENGTFVNDTSSFLSPTPKEIKVNDPNYITVLGNVVGVIENKEMKNAQSTLGGHKETGQSQIENVHSGTAGSAQELFMGSNGAPITNMAGVDVRGRTSNSALALPSLNTPAESTANSGKLGESSLSSGFAFETRRPDSGIPSGSFIVGAGQSNARMIKSNALPNKDSSGGERFGMFMNNQQIDSMTINQINQQNSLQNIVGQQLMNFAGDTTAKSTQNRGKLGESSLPSGFAFETRQPDSVMPSGFAIGAGQPSARMLKYPAPTEADTFRDANANIDLSNNKRQISSRTNALNQRNLINTQEGQQLFNVAGDTSIFSEPTLSSQTANMPLDLQTSNRQNKSNSGIDIGTKTTASEKGLKQGGNNISEGQRLKRFRERLSSQLNNFKVPDSGQQLQIVDQSAQTNLNEQASQQTRLQEVVNVEPGWAKSMFPMPSSNTKNNAFSKSPLKSFRPNIVNFDTKLQEQNLNSVVERPYVIRDIPKSRLNGQSVQIEQTKNNPTFTLNIQNPSRSTNVQNSKPTPNTFFDVDQLKSDVGSKFAQNNPQSAPSISKTATLNTRESTSPSVDFMTSFLNNPDTMKRPIFNSGAQSGSIRDLKTVNQFGVADIYTREQRLSPSQWQNLLSSVNRPSSNTRSNQNNIQYETVNVDLTSRARTEMQPQINQFSSRPDVVRHVGGTSTSIRTMFKAPGVANGGRNVDPNLKSGFRQQINKVFTVPLRNEFVATNSVSKSATSGNIDGQTDSIKMPIFPHEGVQRNQVAGPNSGSTRAFDPTIIDQSSQQLAGSQLLSNSAFDPQAGLRTFNIGSSVVMGDPSSQPSVGGRPFTINSANIDKFASTGSRLGQPMTTSNSQQLSSSTARLLNRQQDRGSQFASDNRASQGSGAQNGGIQDSGSQFSSGNRPFQSSRSQFGGIQDSGSQFGSGNRALQGSGSQFGSNSRSVQDSGSQFASDNRQVVFGTSGANQGRTLGTRSTGSSSSQVVGGAASPVLAACKYEPDPTSRNHFIYQFRGFRHRFRCALGTAFDAATCECSTIVASTGDCLEVHMDFNGGRVEDSSINRLPIGVENVEVTNQSTPLTGVAVFGENSKLTIWRYQNYDFRDHIMLKVQFRPGQGGGRFQPLISNCDALGGTPSVAIVYDSQQQEVLLVLKTDNDTNKELSFPVNPNEWNDVTYIYDGQEFIGIVNGVRRYVSRQDPHLLGIIGGEIKSLPTQVGSSVNVSHQDPHLLGILGGEIKSLPAQGLIEIRDAALVLGHCPRWGYYNGAMVDIQVYTCIPRDFRLE